MIIEPSASKAATVLFIGLLLAVWQASCPASGLEDLQKGNPLSRHIWESAEDEIVVPFDWYDGHLILEVRVNELQGVRLALDSGAAATVLFETERTRSLDLDVERTLTIGAGRGKPGTLANIVKDARISLPGVTLTGLTILHVPLKSSPLFASIDEAYFDGAIGYDLLRRFVTRIDYLGRTITFWREPQNLPSGAGWRTVAADLSGRVPVITTQLASDGSRTASVELLVDTGAPSYVYLNPELGAGITVPRSTFLTRGSGFNGPFERLTGRVRAFSIGDFRFEHLVTHFDRGDFEGMGRGIGLIGNGILRKFDLIFDYRAGRIGMRPNARFDEMSEADRTGLDLEPHRLGGVVQSVAASSGAEQIQLQSGDIVTRIDGEPLGPQSFDTLKGLLSSDREEVEICWQRHESELCRRLPLADRF